MLWCILVRYTDVGEEIEDLMIQDPHRVSSDEAQKHDFVQSLKAIYESWPATARQQVSAILSLTDSHSSMLQAEQVYPWVANRIQASNQSGAYWDRQQVAPPEHVDLSADASPTGPYRTPQTLQPSSARHLEYLAASIPTLALCTKLATRSKVVGK